jgi:hypothetical protein
MGFVLGMNVFSCSRLVEAIVDRNAYGMVPWLVTNGCLLFLCAIYIVTFDMLVGFIVYVFFCKLWMSIAMVWLEFRGEDGEKIPLENDCSNCIESA